MPLSAGEKLGPYEIVALIGQGGMGEVYRAHDTKLKREAEVLASLDHPNIGAIYGLVEANGTPSLVLALVEGPTLDERIAAGPLPLEEALPIARQIVAALEYAHERGAVLYEMPFGRRAFTLFPSAEVAQFPAPGLQGRAMVERNGSPMEPCRQSTMIRFLRGFAEVYFSCPGRATTPSCCHMPSKSSCSQASTILPPAMR